MRKAWMGLLCGLLAGVAQSAPAEPPAIEASMQVTGTLSVDEAGVVTGYALDQREKLPPPVVELLAKTLPTVRFQPVLHDGRPSAVQAKMTLQVVAHRIDPQHAAVALQAAHFVETSMDTTTAPATNFVSIARRVPITYPPKATMAGLSGTVYVALRIDRTGHVVDAQARQVNLRYLDKAERMDHWREVLALPTLERVRQYTFHVPTTGPHADDAYFSGVLCVVYLFEDQHLPGYGEWDSHIPGPKQDIAWLDADNRGAVDNTGALANGEFALAGSGMKLLTPLDGG